MKKKINIDFEVFLDNALRSHGYLFPETDTQMEVYERSVELKELPSNFKRHLSSLIIRLQPLQHGIAQMSNELLWLDI